MERKDYTKILKALSDDTRIQIFEMLRGGTLCACKILEKLNITQPTLSHHMKVLCDCGLVQAEREWKWTYYSLVCPKLNELIDFLGNTKCRTGKTNENCCHKKNTCD
jgi:ArsR family transcriptional regulator